MRERVQSPPSRSVRLGGVMNLKNPAETNQRMTTLMRHVSQPSKAISPTLRGSKPKESGTGRPARPQENNPGRVAYCQLPTCLGGRNGLL
jgi:hypothetical protein